MPKDKGIHWDFYNDFRSKYPATYARLAADIQTDVNRRIFNGDDYILAQDLAGKLNTNDYQFEKKIPENILHSLAGMELYKLMESVSRWIFEKTELRGKDYNQTIYFKVRKKTNGGN